MHLFANPDRPDHAENNAAFRRIVNRFPELKLFQPSPTQAPWHWQSVIDGTTPTLMNFWPHTGKAQIEGEKSVEGEDRITDLIERAFREAEEEPFEVLE